MRVSSVEAANLNRTSTVRAHDARKRNVWLYSIAAFLALIGLADALYLTVEHISGRGVRCTVSGGCNEVLGSAYATLPGGIPLASLGAVAYFMVFSLATLAAFGYRAARTALVLLAALMLAVSLWLLFVQAYVLRAFCEYCLLSAAITLLLTGLVIAGRFVVRIE